MICLYCKTVGHLVMVYDNLNRYGVGRDRMEATNDYERNFTTRG